MPVILTEIYYYNSTYTKVCHDTLISIIRQAIVENFFNGLTCEFVQHFHNRFAAEAASFRYIKAYYDALRPHSEIG